MTLERRHITSDYKKLLITLASYTVYVTCDKLIKGLKAPL